MPVNMNINGLIPATAQSPHPPSAPSPQGEGRLTTLSFG